MHGWNFPVSCHIKTKSGCVPNGIQKLPDLWFTCLPNGIQMKSKWNVPNGSKWFGTPWKINMNHKKCMFGKWCSFSKGWFLGSEVWFTNQLGRPGAQPSVQNHSSVIIRFWKKTPWVFQVGEKKNTVPFVGSKLEFFVVFFLYNYSLYQSRIFFGETIGHFKHNHWTFQTQLYVWETCFFNQSITSANGLACWFGARWFGFLESQTAGPQTNKPNH